MHWSVNLLVFVVAALIIGRAGTKMAGLADQLADRTGVGEAIAGTIFLGISTSLAGITASVTAALEGHAALALSNAMGGIAVQTAFLAIADLTYTKANLEHAAASITNMIQATLLILLLAIVLLGLSGPEISVTHIHPISFLIGIALLAGFLLVYQTKEQPMWRPKSTSMTVEDVPERQNLDTPLKGLVLRFARNAVTVMIAGAVVAHTSANIAQQTGMTQTIAGALLSAVATSLPELVTTIASVKRGALTLAVSDIVGGNCFDVLFVLAADIAYLKGSIYHGDGVGKREIFLTTITVLLNVVILLGLLYRQKKGPANIGFESILVFVLYLAGLAVVSFGM
jgi:cation:H+ antiporter